MNSVLYAARRVQWVRWILRRIRRTMRLGVSCLMHELGVTCGSAFELGASDLPLAENRGEPDLGFRCGSASPVCYFISLGRRLSLDLHAARRRLGVVCQWIQMRLGVAWALSVTEFRCGSAPLG